ncbi:hypothetical protein HS7_05330 [Sulfolobales archaeon HS-7]|nr:hypothetical protein HS7_05330 [Sulfolobales archaeon HS-7]
MSLVEKVTSERTQIVSYYNLPKLTIVIEVAKAVSKEKPVCIFNFEILQNMITGEDIKLSCVPDSYIIQIEPEVVNPRSNLVTLIKPTKGFFLISVSKVGDSRYLAEGEDGWKCYFKITGNRLEEIKPSNVQVEILKLIRENGSMKMRDIVEIVSRRSGIDRQCIREEIGELLRRKAVKMEKGVVTPEE